ncbi:MAG: sugar transferase [Myxococcales bacterium]|nr:sugar transferase [Myxococcales bacterium]MDH5565038.1 sugar transferase [Myxococcales bacterium]
MRIGLGTLRWLHVATDALLVSLGWLGAYALRSTLADALGRPINPLDWYVQALPIVVLPWIGTCWWFGIYHSPRMRTPLDELQRLLRGGALGLLVLGSISFFFKELHFGRTVVVLSVAFNVCLQGASRLAFHALERRLRRSGCGDIPALIVGTGVPAIRLLQKLQDHPETGYRVVGFLDDCVELPEKDVANRPVLGNLDSLRSVALAHGVREIFVALPSLGHTRMLSLVLACEDLGITFRVVTNLFEVLTAGTQIDLVDDLPLVRLGRERVHAFYEPAKRVFDLVGGLAGLLLAGPLMSWVALRLRCSGASPLFVHERVGRGGRRFRMYKFRTLRDDVGHYEVAPRDRADPRITPYGRWLRNTSIDELPQLFNVLRGEMSLVGPRPEMPFIAAEYDEWQRRRLTVKPGITGLWQILGRKDLPMHENLQYDFYYIRNRSLLLDASILLRTIGAVLSRRGAF